MSTGCLGGLELTGLKCCGLVLYIVAVSVKICIERLPDNPSIDLARLIRSYTDLRIAYLSREVWRCRYRALEAKNLAVISKDTLPLLLCKSYKCLSASELICTKYSMSKVLFVVLLL